MATAEKTLNPEQVSSIEQQLSRENTPDSPVVQELRRQVAKRSFFTPTTSTTTGRRTSGRRPLHMTRVALGASR
jgi:hypothetical protein